MKSPLKIFIQKCTCRFKTLVEKTIYCFLCLCVLYINYIISNKKETILLIIMLIIKLDYNNVLFNKTF